MTSPLIAHRALVFPGARRGPSFGVFALATGLFSGCGGGQAVELTLSVDPAISTEAALAATLADLTFILDSDEGLYPPGAERVTGNTEVKNVDADPELELVTIVPVTDDHLPVVRIERGGLSASAIDVRVLGRSKDTESPVADGQARGLAFSDDVQPESVPFNFRDFLRPPRVRSVYPESGGFIQGCDVSVVTLVFSRPMAPASLTLDSVRAGPQGTTATAVHVQSSGLVADVSLFPPISGDGDQVSFDLQVTTAARAEDGTPLDQAGSEPGAQPFDLLMHLDCTPPSSSPCNVGTCPWACGADKECLHLPEIACVEGMCVPVKCSVECVTDTVCDVLRNTCVPDCRAGGALSACASGSCDLATGLCAE